MPYQMKGEVIPAMKFHYSWTRIFNYFRMGLAILWSFPLLGVPQENCDDLQNLQKLVHCAALNHIETLEKRDDIETTRLLDQVETQGLNPEIESEVWSKRFDDEASNEFTIKWSHQWLRGGKLDARKNLAQSKHQHAQYQFRKVYLEQTREAILTIYRIFALKVEISSLNEIIDSYQRILKAYEKRQALAPSHRVSLQIFAMTRMEAQARLREKLDEQISLNAFFNKVGIPTDRLVNFLPSRWPDWPELEKNSGAFPPRNPVKELRQGALLVSKAELEVEMSKSYQDLKVGPMASVETGASQPTWGIGLTISIDLPVKQSNEAGIKYAREKLRGQEFLLDQEQSRLASDYQTLQERYATLKQEIKELPSDAWLEKTHQDLESEIRRGMIDAPLIIEGHEQHHKIIERRNLLRLRLLEILLNTCFFKGQSLLEVLP